MLFVRRPQGDSLSILAHIIEVLALVKMHLQAFQEFPGKLGDMVKTTVYRVNTRLRGRAKKVLQNFEKSKW